jgi:hypothetical protein
MRGKQHAEQGERSRVRILFVEGDFAPGDMEGLTAAVTSAIKPAQVIVRALPGRVGAPAPKDAANGNGAGEANAADLEPVGEDQGGEDGERVPATVDKGPARPRNYRKPRPVEMDMNAGGKVWKDFAAEKGPISHRAKYLVAAAWLHDYAKIQTITADHVFTCYKAAGWNFDIGDPTVTFRQFKKEGLGAIKRGSFSINHLGLAEVVDMKPAAG